MAEKRKFSDKKNQKVFPSESFRSVSKIRTKCTRPIQMLITSGIPIDAFETFFDN